MLAATSSAAPTTCRTVCTRHGRRGAAGGTGGTGATAGRAARGTACVAVAAVAFALLATLTVRQAESGAQTQVDAEDAATAAASTAVETMLSYDHATIADDLDAATTLMTPDFAKEYEELAPQVIAAAEQRKIDVAATVRAIAPLECGQECSTSQVRLLAFVDQHRTIAGKPGTPAALSAVVTMKKVDGTWRVAGLTTS